MVYIWTTIYQEFEKQFYFQNINTDKYFNANYEKPDYDTDIYFVPKHRKYCLANFLYVMLNKKEKLNNKRLFLDSSPNNAMKQDLGKLFKLTNKQVYERYVSKKLIEKRKVGLSHLSEHPLQPQSSSHLHKASSILQYGHRKTLQL